MTSGASTMQAGEPGGGAAAVTDVALMRIEGVLVALPIGSIREVVAGRDAYCPLPVRAEGLLGAIDLGTLIVPVLDLRPAMGLPETVGGAHILVIIRWQTQLLGLRVCELGGLTRLRREELFPLSVNGAAAGVSIASHTFRHGTEVATLLDAGAIAGRPDLPLVIDAPVSRATQEAAPRDFLMLFDDGCSRFAIDAFAIEATVPQQRIACNALTVGICLGSIDHRGYRLPVIDMTAAMGQRSRTPPQQAPVMVLRFGGAAMLGVVIEAVTDVVWVARSDVLAMPQLVTDRAALFRGMLLSTIHGPHLLLDIDRLRADSELVAIAGLRRPLPQDSARRLAVMTARPADEGPTLPYLNYTAGGSAVTPLVQIKQILPYPDGIARFDLQRPGMIGLITHCGQVVPLVNLGTLLGAPFAIDPQCARVLLVEDAGRTVGFVVEALRSVEQGCPRTAGPLGESRGMLKDMIVLGGADAQRLVSSVDLIAMMQPLFGSAAPTPSSSGDEAAAGRVSDATALAPASGDLGAASRRLDHASRPRL